MRTLTDEEKTKLMDELITSIRSQREKFPYEVTAQEFAEAVGYTEEYARKFLSKQVKDGKMQRRYVRQDSKMIVVYSVI